MLRMIREVEPPKPSTKLSSSEELPSIAAKRKLEPKKLTKLVQGELDWIVMKCLEKERARRYETANGLALDLQRYLHDEPVLAGPPSAGYRLRKFVKRNKGPVLAASLVLLALIGGVIGTTIGLIRSNQAETEARTQAQKARQAAEAERLAKVAAEDRRRQAEAVADWLQALFTDLHPRQEAEHEVDLKQRLVARLVMTAAKLEQADSEPLTRARLQCALAETWLGLGEPQKALSLLQQALETYMANRGADDANTLSTLHNVARAYQQAGQLAQAIPLYEHALEKMKKQLGPAHPFTLTCMASLAEAYRDDGQVEKATALLEQTLAKQQAQLRPNHLLTLTTLHNLDMPLFLTPGVYVPVPLEKTYQSAWEAVPSFWRDVLTGPIPP
jgi:tetratricopeptide (TPR) repeat protein